MPSEKIRSKEDTWSTNELKKALNKDEIRKERERLKRERRDGKGEDINEYEEKERRHRRDDDDERRRHRGDEDRKKHRDSKREKTEEEREAERRERRERKEGKSSSKTDDKRKDEDKRRHRDDDERKERRHRDRDEERHRDRDDRDRDEERERRRREKEAEREKRHRDKDEKHRDREGKSEDRRRRHRDEDDDDKRRRHRDEDGDDKRRRHKEEDGDDRRRRHKEDDGDDRRRRHRDEEDEDRKRRHRKDEDDRERRKDRHKEDEDDEERRRRKEKEREKEKQREREKEREREKAKEAEEENGYDEYEDDFEDYEDDFEDEEDEAPVAKGKLSDFELHKSPPKGGHGLDYSDSEMDEVLKALDQENERLQQDSRQQPESPRDQRESSYNRYNNNYDDQDSDSEPARPVTRGLINFSGARQRAMSRKAHSKTTKRAHDLLQMIELDVSSYDLFDLPPVKEYDLYIRSFGRTDTKQAYVQTNDDNIDRDIQTDEIDLRQKWTQHPPEDFTGCGRGDGEKDLDEEESAQQNKQQDLGRLNSFIQKAGQVISILLDEEKDQQRQEKADNRTNLALSEGYSQLTCLSILKGRSVQFAHFSPTQPNYLLTIYNKPAEASESNPVDRKGIICVWNTNEPSYPQRILACESQPVCCCFSPYKTTLVFAGMVDGSVCAWDLREPPALHKSVHYENSDHLLRYPTYNTAGIVEVDNHHSPITTLTPVVSYTDSDSAGQDSHEDSSGGLTFQLVSCEEMGILKFWVVAEISSPDMAGSEVDLGLSPGGRIKLVLSSSMKLRNPLREKTETTKEKQGYLRTFELQLSPGDLNHYYVGTEKGFVYHGLRFGSKAYPRMFTALSDAPVDIRTLDFSPFCHPCFLATTGDGDVHLFSTKTDTALVSWPARVWGTTGVRCAKWSPSRPCVFYVLDDNSRLYTFDLLEGDSMPAKIETLSPDAKVTCLAFTSDVRTAGQGGRNPQMLICMESGVTQIHTIAKEFREQQTLEDEFLPSYLARF
ncbi:cytoplasmic dynein 2 intermediate chain 1-like isoform X9 [Crassostrea angulata]|uniref:cytoplasmic dynein 2 intermediate chain 1-like isoform X9 n=1 Tax=Magallana angulata TaxID=2784310 RepID=UPI0022B16EFE|nr:cytoplasmic dynein 2 intermediate chain 1-like isoform X9 [Crassostrea angulata]